MPTPAETFRALHAQPGLLLCGSAWDAGTARIAADLGFPALETTSAGFAFSTGRPDAKGLLQRDEMLASLAAIAAAVPIPVSADLENGFGDAPDDVAETIRRAIGIGLAGGSIEDATGRPDDPLYPLDHAVARIQAAVSTAGDRFVLTGRCDAFMHGRGDLSLVIERLRAYAAAGAEVLSAPGLPDRAAVETVVQAVGKPLALYVGLGSWRPDAAELAAIGVKRAASGSGLARVAWSAFLEAATEIRRSGTFTRVAAARPFPELNGLFGRLHDQA